MKYASILIFLVLNNIQKYFMFAVSGIISPVFILSFGNFVYREQAGVGASGQPGLENSVKLGMTELVISFISLVLYLPKP